MLTVTGEKRSTDVCEEYCQLYKAAHNNAVSLLSGAQLLFQQSNYATAFFLALTALEEISKSQLAADVWTGLISEAAFLDHYKSHPKKLERMAWATEEAQRYLDLDLRHPDINIRSNALYVSLKSKNVQAPSDVITQEEAQGLIHTVEVALHGITQNDLMGYAIGTKGFM